VYGGHVGLALALRRVPGAPPLWLLVLAAQGPDWGDATLDALGAVGRDPAWGPHALPLVGAGAAVLAGAAALRAAHGVRGRAALLGGGAYVAHWGCDFVTGHKPTWPGGPVVGLDLYHRPFVDFAVEAAVIAAGGRSGRGRCRRRTGGRAGPARHSCSWRSSCSRRSPTARWPAAAAEEETGRRTVGEEGRNERRALPPAPSG
jgi:hypothetical protein